MSYSGIDWAIDWGIDLMIICVVSMASEELIYFLKSVQVSMCILFM